MTIVSIALISLFLFSALCIRHYLRNDDKKLDKTAKLTDILTGVAAMLVGIVSTVVMLSQNRMQQMMIAMQRNEHQPAFIIDYTKYIDSKKGTMCDYEEFKVINAGERPKSIDGISLSSYIAIQYDRPRAGISIETYLPLTYFLAIRKTNNLQGELQYSIGGNYTHNNLKVYEFHCQAVDYGIAREDVYLETERIDLFRIDYTDMYDCSHTCFFKKGSPTGREEYERIRKIAAADFGERLYDTDELNLDILWSDCRSLRQR